MVGCEYDEATGIPYYREIIITVPRQQGKTTLFVSWQIHRCLSPRWAQPQRSMYTAQSGKDARDKWLDEIFPLIDNSPFGRIAKLGRGMGNESVAWANSSLIRLLSTSEASGHSKTIHQSVMDEVWKDMDDRREQALRPAMITVDDAQLLVCSTAGFDDSVVYNKKVEVGRRAVKADTGRGVCYIEYSAPEGWDPYDDASFFGFMPALCPDPPCRCGQDDGGWRHTITLDVIRAERDDSNMDPADFARAYGNIPAPRKAADRPFAAADWAALARPRKRRPSGIEPKFFVQVAPDSLSAAIAAAYLVRGKPYVELAAYEPGTAWLARKCRKLAARYPWATWAIAAAGAAGAEAPGLDLEGIEVEQFSTREMGQASLHLQQLVADQAMAHSGNRAFQHSVAGAVRRSVGEELWVFSPSKSSVDVAPITAAAGALWLLENDLGLPVIL